MSIFSLRPVQTGGLGSVFFLFFFTGKKNQKPRDPKNSLLGQFICIWFWFAFSPGGIPLAPLFVFMAKKRPSCLLKQFWATYPATRSEFLLTDPKYNTLNLSPVMAGT